MTITIRRATPKDAAAHARILADPGVQPGLLQMPYVDEAILFARLTDACAPGKLDLPLSAELDGDIVGSAGLHPVGPQVRRRHVLTFGISVLPSAQGRGVGTALMAAMCDYADRWIGARRMELTVYTDNEPAVRLYRRFGFEIEGTLRGYAMRDGLFVDAYTMARWIPATERLAPPA
jgi:putative acetyltransferase